MLVAALLHDPHLRFPHERCAIKEQMRGQKSAWAPGRVEVDDHGLALADEVGELLGLATNHGDVEIDELRAN